MYLAIGFIVYLVIGIILTHHTDLGKEEFSGHPTKLIFLWILPVLAYLLFIAGISLLDLCDKKIFPEKIHEIT